jgi:hypothetical protein
MSSGVILFIWRKLDIPMILNNANEASLLTLNVRSLLFAINNLRAPTAAEADSLAETPLSSAEMEHARGTWFEHLSQHSVAVADGSGAVLCPDNGYPCRRYGCAMALFRAMDVIEATADDACVRDLLVKVHDGESWVRGMERTMSTRLKTIAQRHKSGSYRVKHDHVNWCEAPAAMLTTVRNLGSELRRFREFSLLPLFPEEAHGTAGALLATMQSDLFNNGWSAGEVVDILDDGNGGSLRARRARFRMRVKRLEADSLRVRPSELRN